MSWSLVWEGLASAWSAQSGRSGHPHAAERRSSSAHSNLPLRAHGGSTPAWYRAAKESALMSSATLSM